LYIYIYPFVESQYVDADRTFLRWWVVGAAGAWFIRTVITGT